MVGDNLLNMCRNVASWRGERRNGDGVSSVYLETFKCLLITSKLLSHLSVRRDTVITTFCWQGRQLGASEKTGNLTHSKVTAGCRHHKYVMWHHCVAPLRCKSLLTFLTRMVYISHFGNVTLQTVRFHKLYTDIQSVPRSKHSPSRLYKPVS